MRKYRGGESVLRGVYLDLGSGELVQAYEEPRVLPGGRDIRYVKVPAVLAIAAGPLAGLAFVIFLPLVGIVGAIGFLVYKAGKLMQVLGSRVLRPVAVGWKPGVAYLAKTGRQADKGDRSEETEDPLGMLEKEIAERRRLERD